MTYFQEENVLCFKDTEKLHPSVIEPEWTLFQNKYFVHQ